MATRSSIVGKAVFSLAKQQVNLLFGDHELFDLVKNAFSRDIPGMFAAFSDHEDDADQGLTIECLAKGCLEPPLVDQPLLPLERSTFKLQRERLVRGWVMGEVLHMDDGRHFLDLHYSKGHARGFFTPVIRTTPRLLTHTYLLVALIELLRARGVFYLHGALVCSPEGYNVLLLGDGGAGKSTSVYSLVRQGWQYVGDDALLLRLNSDGQVVVYPLLRRLLLHGDMSHWFPGLLLERLEEGDKGRVSLQCLPQQGSRASAVPTTALILKRQRYGVTRIDRARNSQLVAALVQQNQFLFLQSELAARHLDILSRLAKQCDGGILHLAPDVLAQPTHLGKAVGEFAQRCQGKQPHIPAPGSLEVSF